MTLWRSVLRFVSRHALAAGMALCTLGPAAAQVDFSKVEITTEKLADGIFERWGKGSIKPDAWVTMLATTLRP